MTHILELDAYELHLEDGQVFNDLMNARVLHNMNDRVDYYSKYIYIFMLIIIYDFFLSKHIVISLICICVIESMCELLDFTKKPWT